MEAKALKFAIESLLFASEKPLTVEQIKQGFEDKVSVNDIRNALEALRREYEEQQRGFSLMEIVGGYQLVSHPRFADVLRKFFQEREKKRLSQASLETLSVIAYKQPVTRADIEFIRGVNVDGAVRTLLEKGLIKIAGRKDVPGRPMLYATTKQFLDHFALNSLKDLPLLTEFQVKDLDPGQVPPELKEAGPSSAEAAEGAPAPRNTEAKKTETQG